MLRLLTSALLLVSVLLPWDEAAAVPVSFSVGIRIDYLDLNEAPGSAFNLVLQGSALGDTGTLLFEFDTDDLVNTSGTAFTVPTGLLSVTMTLPAGMQTESGSQDDDPWDVVASDGATDGLDIDFYEFCSGIGAGFFLLDPTGTAIDLTGVSDPADLFLSFDPTSFSGGTWYADSECCSAASGSIFAIPEPTTALLLQGGLGFLALRRRRLRTRDARSTDGR